MRAKVHKDECIGCGMCVNICPEVFSMGEDEKAFVIKDTSPETEQGVADAMENCPVAAISEE